MDKFPYDGVMSDKIDIKVFILFLLDELKYPLSQTMISDIVSENRIVGRFDFAECFSELVEKGHVIAYEDEGETVYVVSPLGHMVASELQGTLHDSIRQRSRQSAMKHLSLHLRGAKLHTDIQKTKDGVYTVECRITDRTGELLYNRLTVSSEGEAKAIVKHFTEHPDEVCRGVLSVMTGKIAYYMG